MLENREKKLGKGLCALVGLVAIMLPARAQEIRLGDGRAAAKGHVVVLTDAVELEAGKASVVELRFRVEQGFHINSHTPKDELLIPTVLKIDAGAVKVAAEEYGPGTAFRLGAGEMLDVYQGEFRVGVKVVAPKGVSVLVGALRYQACDSAGCFPQRTVPVQVVVTGR